MPTAHKAVDADFKSPAKSGTKGWTLGFTDEEWELLQLTYTVGSTVTPDPDVETAVKLGNPEFARHVLGWTHQPNGSNGIYASTANAPARERRWAPRDGHVVVLTYDSSDVIGTLPGYAQVQLRSATVVEIWTP